MKKLLIINLNRAGDIFQMGHIISSLIKERPQLEIHLLCYEEFKTAAKILRNIENIYTLNRKKIISFYKNNIYSDGLAFNEIEMSLHDIDQNFDALFNYSNDKVSTYISSFLNLDRKIPTYGLHFSPAKTIQYSSQDAITLNDILTTFNNTPFNFNDTYHRIINAHPETRSEIKVRTNIKHDKTARENLTKLRKTKGSTQGKSFIVGIQISTSSETKDIPQSILEQLIQKTINSPEIIPLILIAPNEKERLLASTLSQHFSNKLMSVEADFIALPSVLLELDALITPDTAVKHLADLTNTPCIEISLGEAPFLKQGSINPNSIIVTRPPNLRVFKRSIENKKQTIEENRSLSPQLIYHSLRALLNLNSDNEFREEGASEFCIYRPIPLKQGVVYNPISGPYSTNYEIRRLIARASIIALTGNKVERDLYDHIILNFDRKDIIQTVNKEKESLSDLTKDLLSTLRGLIQIQENRNKTSFFIQSLETLLSNCFNEKTSALPTLFFRAKLESLCSSSIEENLKEVESLLYSFKDDLQVCFSIFKSIENHKISENNLEQRMAEL